MRKWLIVFVLGAIMVAALSAVWNRKPIMEQVEAATWPWQYMMKRNTGMNMGNDVCYTGGSIAEQSTVRCSLRKESEWSKNESGVQRSVRSDRMDTGMRTKMNTREYGKVGGRQSIQGISNGLSRKEIHNSPLNNLFQ